MTEGVALLGRPPPFDPHVSGENIAAVLVDSLSNGVASVPTDQLDIRFTNLIAPSDILVRC